MSDFAGNAFQARGASRQVTADTPLVELTARPRETTATVPTPSAAGGDHDTRIAPPRVSVPFASAEPTQREQMESTPPTGPEISTNTRATSLGAPVPGTSTAHAEQPSSHPRTNSQEPVTAEGTAGNAPPSTHPGQPHRGYHYPPPPPGYPPYPHYHPMMPHWGHYPPPYPYMHPPYGTHPPPPAPSKSEAPKAVSNPSRTAAPSKSPASTVKTSVPFSTADKHTTTKDCSAQMVVEVPRGDGRKTARVALNIPNRDELEVKHGQRPDKSVARKDPAGKSSKQDCPVPSDKSSAVEAPSAKTGARTINKTAAISVAAKRPAQTPTDQNAAAPPVKKTKRRTTRPLSEQEILRSFPTADASSVLMLHGRKIDMDGTPGLDTVSTPPLLPLYPILRAWIQDDPFRTIPRPEASVDIWSTSQSAVRDGRTVSGPSTMNVDNTEAAKAPSPNTATIETKFSMAVNQSEKSVDNLRNEMIQRGKVRRRLQSKVVQQGQKVGLERLRQRGIHI